MAQQAHDDVPGEQAERPQDIPKRGWIQIAKRGWKEAKADQVPLLAAGVAYYAFMSLFPALIALVLIYGLVADPGQIAREANQLTGALPGQVRQLITNQLTMVSQHNGGAGIGAIGSILVALWSASSGTSNLITAISTAYDEEETRSFIKKRALALALTVGAIIFMIVMLFLVAALPAVLQLFNNVVIRVLLEVVRWALLVVLITVALAVLYRVAPDRDAPKIKWVSVGAMIATVLWAIASVGFSIYVANFGNYAKTYGAVAGIVVLLFWLWITSYAVLLGAEINAESEQQTIADTTRGEPRPLGERDAVKADSVPEPASDAKSG
ncbi:ribonuclease [Microlunatus endophyticus]|uniref:Ribonuclease n=1 Tax=Microlunatus endophyticus TaxID=1716077 RepID=A0A917W616_9ACTN|nr:YihY/virulence factor BrkB family protein [Microlunatus endophyticus]GGL73084.1 ribonuclease [Microlunatus endophyticus]